MAKKDPRIDAYIAKAKPFAKPILKHLREVVHAGCPEVEETLKWSMPHFQYKGLLCGMAAFNEHCTFGFWKEALVFGRERLAGRDAMGDFGRITAVSDLPSEKKLIGYVKKAVEVNEAPVKSSANSKPKTKPALLKIPDYFTTALKKNKKALKTFEEFPYSKRKEYVVWVTEAKREETRQQRLATSVKWLSEGKSHHWRYQDC